jgi:hypothetical protein
MSELSELEKKVCALCMVSESDFLAQKRKDAETAKTRKDSKLTTMQTATDRMRPR